MLHTLIMKIIPGDHNDMNVMQSSLTGESKSSINSGPNKMLMIFYLTFIGSIKYLALSGSLFEVKTKKSPRGDFLRSVAVYKTG
jgi:hypothetical protein